MNILPATVLPAGVAAAAQIAATTPLSGTLAASALSLPEPGSTTVELSRLGMFLSSLALARKKIADLGQPAGNAANPPVDDFAAVAGAARDLVDAFNNLRTDGIDTIQTSADALLEQQLRQNLTQAGQAETSTDPAVLAGIALAGIGLTLQAATPDAADTLALDLPALQAAFTANPAATLAQLRQTAIAFGTLGAAFAQQDIDLAAAPDVAPQATGVTLPADLAIPVGAGAAPAIIAAAPDATVITGTQVDGAAAPVGIPNNAPVLAPNSAPAEAAAPGPAALPQNSVADMALGDLLTEIKNNATLQDNGAAAALAAAGDAAADAVAAAATAQTNAILVNGEREASANANANAEGKARLAAVADPAPNTPPIVNANPPANANLNNQVSPSATPQAAAAAVDASVAQDKATAVPAQQAGAAAADADLAAGNAASARAQQLARDNNPTLADNAALASLQAGAGAAALANAQANVQAGAKLARANQLANGDALRAAAGNAERAAADQAGAQQLTDEKLAARLAGARQAGEAAQSATPPNLASNPASNPPPSVANDALPAVPTPRNAATPALPNNAAPAIPPAAPAIEPLQDAGHANVLAHDSAVAAAIAAYNLNQGPFRTGSNGNPELASNARREVIAPVQAVTRVAAVNPIGKPGAGR